MDQTNFMGHREVIVIGGGQAGLSASYYLQRAGIDHLVLEKDTVMHHWRDQRWDSFCLVTPNWQCTLPGHAYGGDDPNGFMVKSQIIEYLDEFAHRVNAPLREGVTVKRVLRCGAGFDVHTTAGRYSAAQVVAATGAYHTPVIPDVARKLPAEIVQLHAGEYVNADALPDGDVLVVGAGQSGAQIAEDLMLQGRQVHLATGRSPRVARFYRGRDVVQWLDDMGYYQMPVEQHPLREGVRDNTNHYVTGRDGGRDIDLRQFARKGMRLYGVLQDYSDQQWMFAPNLGDSLDYADEVYNNICRRIDQYIAKQGVSAPVGRHYEPVWRPEAEIERLPQVSTNIRSVIWCVGFKPNFSWCELPVFDAKGYPQHYRGVTRENGLYFLGLPWLHTWGSGRFSGVAKDAEYVAARIVNHELENRADRILASMPG